MFSNLKNIFKVEDLRKKVFFTLAMIMVYRFGAGLRVPGIDASAVAQLRCCKVLVLRLFSVRAMAQHFLVQPLRRQT